MGFWKNWTRPRRSVDEIRGTVANEVIELQLDIVKLLDPDAPFTLPLRETNYLASAVVGAIISTTPGKSPHGKDMDLIECMDILIHAVDPEIEEAPPEEQDEFQVEFKERWDAYLLPTAYLLGEPDTYASLDKTLFLLLAARMGFEPLMVEAIQMEVQLEALIRKTANRIWPILNA